MPFIPKAHEIYKHFKGNLYQIVAIAEHSETGEQLVIYQALYGDFKIYARPLAMFTSRVDKQKYPEAGQEFRFELQGPDSARQLAESERHETPAAREGISENTAAGEEISQNTATGERISERAAAREGISENAAAGEGISENAATRTEVSRTQAAKKEPSESSTGMASEYTEEELSLDPMVLEFLDADSYEQRLNILAGLHHRVTDEMITTMSIACDIEVEEGSTEERYESLKNCLLTLERYECNRLR